MIGDGAGVDFHAGSPECGTAKQGGEATRYSEEAAARNFHGPIGPEITGFGKPPAVALQAIDRSKDIDFASHGEPAWFRRPTFNILTYPVGKRLTRATSRKDVLFDPPPGP
jgi:hypothetical protein